MYAIVRVIVAFLASAAAIAAQAAPITYTITTTATGTLGASPFTNALITVTLTGDTSTVVPGTGGLTGTLLDHGTATVNIAGLGSATFTDSIVVLSSFTNTTIIPGQSAAVIAQEDSGHPANSSVTGIVGLLSPAFFGYSLQTALGPVAGTGGVANDGPVDGVFPTNRGNLGFAAGQNLAGTATFTAALIPPGVDLNQHGLTGSWFEQATSGQGAEVEVFPDHEAPGTGDAFVSWFTYDSVIGGADHQRWYTAQGQVITGQHSAALTIYQNTGGNFDAPPVTTAQAVGTATLSFDTCTSGQLSYNFTDGTGRSGMIPLTRLTQNVTCSATMPHPTNADFALSGNWFGGAATSGQGFTAEVNPINGAFFSAWYTYKPNGTTAGAAGQRWYTAQGAFTPGMRSIPVTIYETTGGMFDTPTPPGQKTVPVGTGTMAFQSCTAATFNYTFTGGTSAGLSSTINLIRVGPVPPGCTS